MAVGALTGGSSNQQRGYVRVYQLVSENNWQQVGNTIVGDQNDDSFGVSVSLTGDGQTVAIGAYLGDNNNTKKSGYVRVYRIIGQTWSPIGQTIYGDAANDQFGKALSFSGTGYMLAIGAAQKDLSTQPGYVKIYDLGGSASNYRWVTIGPNGGKITGEAAGDQFGHSLSLSDNGNVLIVGAPFNDGPGKSKPDVGHARVFHYLGPNTTQGWTQIGSDIDGETVNDGSGWSVDMAADGRIVAISSPNNPGTGSLQGHVRVYVRTESDLWAQLGPDIDGEQNNDKAGFAVALSGDGQRLAIGSIDKSVNGASSGQTRVFYRDANDLWKKVGSSINGLKAYDRSGASLALSYDGSYLAIGARQKAGTNVSGPGYARAFFLSAALPVELVNFTASLQAGAALLKWQTATESQNAGFDVQHSLTGYDWESLAFEAGAGDSQELLDYSYLHSNVPAGVNYYRLVQQDLDGTTSVSEVVSVYQPGVEDALTLFPNPATDRLRVSSVLLEDPAAILLVVDAAGREVFRRESGLNEPLDVAYLPRGVYALRLQANGRVETARFVKQ